MYYAIYIIYYIPHYNLLYYTISDWDRLHWTILYSTRLCCTILQTVTALYTVPYCNILHYTVRHSTLLRYIPWHYTWQQRSLMTDYPLGFVSQESTMIEWCGSRPCRGESPAAQHLSWSCWQYSIVHPTNFPLNNLKNQVSRMTQR